MLEDRRLKVREIAKTESISKDCVDHILHEILGMRKLSARRVPCLLRPDNKRNRKTTSKQCLTLFKRNPKEFLRRFVTVDETWMHWYTPETKEQLKQWTSPGERAPKKAKTLLSAGKIMATVFWDSHRRCESWRRAKRSQGSTMPNYWADSTPNCRENGPI